MNFDLLQEAARRAQGADPASARPILARLRADDPAHPDVLTLVGIVAQRTGDAAAALAAFAQARAADPANPARLGNLAMALKALGRFDEAIAALSEADRLRPGHAVTLTNLGACLIEAERAVEAETPLRAALRGKPDHAEALNNLGIVLARTGRGGEAISAYRQALTLRPNWAEAMLNLGDALRAAGDLAEARDLASIVARQQPGHQRAANQLAAIAEAQGDPDGAIRFYRDALERSFSHPVAHNLALALLRRGDAQDALDLARRMIAESPSVTTPLALAFAALRGLERDEEATALASLDRALLVTDVASVPGFASQDAFHAALVSELTGHPSLQYEPEGLVTRRGRQSADLVRSGTPALSGLLALAREQLAAHHARIVPDDHPWAAARPNDWSVTLWGTILSPGGAVESHIHAPNWLSGVYYPDLPSEVARGEQGGFAIGCLPAALGGGAPLHRIEAKPGRMILFPSFLWHATLPFEGPADRISFAFDLVPVGTGRPHRLRP